jgi:hypothetical protein
MPSHINFRTRRIGRDRQAPRSPHQFKQLRTSQAAIPTPQPHPSRDGSAMKSKAYASTKTKPPLGFVHLLIEGAAKVFTVALSPAGGARLPCAKSPRQIALMTGEKMDLRMKTCLTAVAVLVLSLPIWARSDSAQLVIDHPVTIGAQQLEPGTYNIKANDGENQISIVRADDGKTIASVPCEWVQLAQKPRETEVLFNADRVVEIDFGGKTKAVAIR